MSPTAIREIMLLKALRHEHLVRLTAIHLDRQVCKQLIVGLWIQCKAVAALFVALIWG